MSVVASVALYTPACVQCKLFCAARCSQGGEVSHFLDGAAVLATSVRLVSKMAKCALPIPAGPTWVRVGGAARACLCASLRVRASEAGEAGAGDSLGPGRARARAREGWCATLLRAADIRWSWSRSSIRRSTRCKYRPHARPASFVLNAMQALQAPVERPHTHGIFVQIFHASAQRLRHRHGRAWLAPKLFRRGARGRAA